MDYISMSAIESQKTAQRKRGKFGPFKVRIGNRTYWQVNLEGQTIDREGRRIRIRPRRTFSNAEEAKAFANLKKIERKNRGTLGVSMDEKLRGDAIESQRILEPYGVSILDAARDYIRRVEVVTKSKSVSDAVRALVDAKQADNLRPRYLKDLRDRLRRFVDQFGERKLADIQPAEIDQWLRELCLSPLSRNTFRLRLFTLFEHGRQCGWASTNPVADVRKVKVTEAIPGILEPAQIARLLEAASSETLPYLAIGTFAGLRSAELERLQWKDIHFDERLIEVPALTSKTASRRFVPIRDNLLVWLEPYRGSRGMVCPPNLRQRLAEDRRRAGIAKWPSNCLRHSFGSYHLQEFKNAAQTALEMGHVKADVTFRFYNQRVRPAAAREFWRIAPVIEGQHKLSVFA
jgi:integrase